MAKAKPMEAREKSPSMVKRKAAAGISRPGSLDSHPEAAAALSRRPGSWQRHGSGTAEALSWLREIRKGDRTWSALDEGLPDVPLGVDVRCRRYWSCLPRWRSPH